MLEEVRIYDAKTDAYRVFKGLLERGNPPDDWEALRKAASDQAARKRLENVSPAKR